jgi:hypothetical protein
MKSGLRVVEDVKMFCAEHSEELICPIFIFLSSYMTQDFKKKIEAAGTGYCFEKPMRRDSMNKIIELMRVQS